MVIERSQNFTKYGFPVDVLWMDIEHALWTEKEDVTTRDYRWFTLNPYNYTTQSLQALKDEISTSKRHLVTIIDPHIQVNSEYFVYQTGIEK
jgi:mannosyl-oligosaccharide alpha-1,3-glucosidase